jgi:hypothetical protein
VPAEEKAGPEQPAGGSPAAPEGGTEHPAQEGPSTQQAGAEKLKGEIPSPKEIGAEPSENVRAGVGTTETDKDARTWAMFCHLAGLCFLVPIVPVIGGIIGPLIVWQIKKEEFGFVDDQGKEAVNFQISILIYALVSGLLCFACVGFVLLPAVYIFDLVFMLIAAVKANDGERYRYPLTIRFIK